jgi:hypothetical protein
VYGSPARMRVEREVTRRSNAPVVISTLLSLLIVGAAVAAVAYLVLRSPSPAVDSAERLEPVGTALPAPSEPPTLPTSVPTSVSDSDAQPEPTALGFTGDAPAVAGLPTVAAPPAVAAPQEAGPTPTPRVIALATAVPATEVPPQSTLPPAVPVESVPVVALAPVEMAPPPAPTATSRSQAVSQPTPVPVEVDDDPFNIFGDGAGPGIVPAQNDALERARALQGQGQEGQGDGNSDRDSDIPVVVPAPVIRDAGPDRSVEVEMPDVDAMIDEITARATDPNRNPNVGNAGRGQEVGDREVTDPGANQRKSARDRSRNRTQTSNSRAVPNPVNPNVPVVVPRGSTTNGQDCGDPFAGLPEDMRPEGFPFNNC